jgi:alpha-beta hydrolase superfamily lysophospholipase
MMVCAAIAMLLPVGYKAGRSARFATYDAHPPRGAAPAPASVGLATASEVEFRTADGDLCRGWYAPSRNGAAIVLTHGSSGTRAGVVSPARILADAGFGVLLFDFPGHGESEGRVTWAEPDRAALATAVGFAAAQPDVHGGRVGVYGFSMGSAIALSEAVDDRRVHALALAGPLTTLHDQLAYENRSWGPITQLPAIWVQRSEGLPVDTMRPIDDARRLGPRPLLVIGGEKDRTCPPSMARELYAAAAEPKDLWIVPGADHGQYDVVAPDAWRRRVVGFFEGALLRESALNR